MVVEQAVMTLSRSRVMSRRARWLAIPLIVVTVLVAGERLGCFVPGRKEVRGADARAATVPTGTPLSKEDAVGVVLELANTGITTKASPDARHLAVLMPIAEFAQREGIGPDPVIAPDLLVWVVTVHAPMSTRGSPVAPPVVKPVYTGVIDAITGAPVIVAVGSATLG